MFDTEVREKGADVKKRRAARKLQRIKFLIELAGEIMPKYL